MPWPLPHSKSASIAGLFLALSLSTSIGQKVKAQREAQSGHLSTPKFETVTSVEQTMIDARLIASYLGVDRTNVPTAPSFVL